MFCKKCDVYDPYECYEDSFICLYSCQCHFLSEPWMLSADYDFIHISSGSPRVRHRGRSRDGGVVSGYLSLPDRLAMHAAQNRAAGPALRLRRWVLSVVKEERLEIWPVKRKPDTALLRAHISYSAKPGPVNGGEALEEWETDRDSYQTDTLDEEKEEWQLYASLCFTSVYSEKNDKKKLKTTQFACIYCTPSNAGPTARQAVNILSLKMVLQCSQYLCGDEISAKAVPTLPNRPGG